MDLWQREAVRLPALLYNIDFVAFCIPSAWPIKVGMKNPVGGQLQVWRPAFLRRQTQVTKSKVLTVKQHQQFNTLDTTD